MNLGDFGSLLFRCSASAAVLVVLVLSIQFVFGRQLGPRWRCALWLIVMVRLFPFSVNSAMSLFNFLPRWPQVRTLAEAPTLSAAEAPKPASLPKDASLEPPTATESDALPDEAIGSPLFERAPGSELAAPISAADRDRAAPGPGRSPGERPWRYWIPWVWLSVSLALLLRLCLSSVRTAARLRTLQPLQEEPVLRLLTAACAEMGVRRAPRLLEGGEGMSPALCGLFRPQLILPKNFLARYGERDLRFVFLHELAHLKRRDLWLNWLVAILQALHWFNPFVWLAFWRWRLDREIACDALALDAAGVACQNPYGHALLRLVDVLPEQERSPGVAGVFENKRQLRRRIQAIAGYLPRRRWPLVAIGLVTAVATAGLTDAAKLAQGGIGAAAGSGPLNLGELGASSSKTIEVLVRAERTGEPLAGAKILVPDPSEPDSWLEAGLSDSRGSFVLPLRPGQEGDVQWREFSFVVSHPSYSSSKISFYDRQGQVSRLVPGRYVVRLEEGRTLGGIVKDEIGNPIAGAKLWLSIYDSSRTGSPALPLRKDERAPFVSGSLPVVTDGRGQWRMEHLPSGSAALLLEVLLPDGTIRRYITAEYPRPLLGGAEPVSLDALRSQNAVLFAKGGQEVHGTVLDETTGRPVADALVRATNSDFRKEIVYSVRTDREGVFRFASSTGTMTLGVEAEGYASTSFDYYQYPDQGRFPMVRLSAARPLRVRVVDEVGTGLGNVAILAKENKRESALVWRGVTDANGGFVWTGAPLGPVSLVLRSGPDSASRAIVDASRNENIVSLRKTGTVEVKLAVVEQKTETALSSFEVWMSADGAAFSPLDGIQEGNGFRALVRPGPDVRKVRFLVRAPEHAVWQSKTLSFDEGDLSLVASLAPGSPLEQEQGVPRLTAFDEKSAPEFVALGKALCDFLQRRDIDGFIERAAVREQDLLNTAQEGSKPEPASSAVLTDSPQRKADTRLLASLPGLLKAIDTIGIPAGSVAFSPVRLEPSSITVRSRRILRGKAYDLAGFYSPLIVLKATALSEKNEDRQWEGEYAFRVEDVLRLPGNWRLQGGIYLYSTTAALPNASSELLRTLDLQKRVFARRPLLPRGTLGTLDDTALSALGDAFATWLAGGTAERLADALVLPSAADEQLAVRVAKQKDPIAAANAVAEEKSRHILALETLRKQLADQGIDFHGAEVRVVRVLVEGAEPILSGGLGALSGRRVSLVFDIKAASMAATGAPISGRYAISLPQPLRIEGHWYAKSGEMRWTAIPEAVLTPEAREALDIENYLIDRQTFPAGVVLPEIELLGLEGRKNIRLSELRGRAVVLMAGTNWSPDAQAQAETLAVFLRRHPELRGKVELVNLIAAETSEQALACIRKMGAAAEYSYWSRGGSVSSPTLRAFVSRGIFRSWVLDKEGRVFRASPLGERLDYEQVLSTLPD